MSIIKLDRHQEKAIRQELKAISLSDEYALVEEVLVGHPKPVETLDLIKYAYSRGRLVGFTQALAQVNGIMKQAELQANPERR